MAIVQKWNIQENKFIILLPGRLTRWKGQENFIEAINLLIENYQKNDFHAIILGSDQGRNVYTKRLQNLVSRYNLTKKIQFIQHCSEMPIAYSIASIVVSSSIEPEAFGRVAVEAQAMKKLIIASDIGGSKETIINGKSGFLYKADDPRELAKFINNSMEFDGEALYLMGNEGRKNVSKKFDVENMCQTTLREYRKLLNN